MKNMFRPPPPIIALAIFTIILVDLVDAGRHHYYGSYVTPYRGNSNQRGYGSYYASYGRNKYYGSYQGYGNNYRTYGNGYGAYPGYGTQAYQGYGTYYSNPGYGSSYYYYGSGDKYIGNGVHVDSHGNGYIGAKDTGLYIFCASRGCVGRGRK
ncbi:hypothetical protein CAEBREN_29756 [Caenorhabditis brenneri]|uniref:Uncharacterized protein n=1 Tax=Caenorhabditis brenneri TaxID=135651 RepID=G0NBZ3_CAEBE|nr:hypothetical protein CAEBREN_29756 [Caenorhabditis brenneri]